MLELQQDDAAQQDMGNYQPYCMGPSALGVDDAISAVQESIDWMRMRSYSLPGDCAHASCSAMGSAALTTEMLAEHCQQASKTLPICTLLAPKPRNIRHDNKQNLVDHNKGLCFCAAASSLPQSSLPQQRIRNGMRGPYRDPLKSSTVNTSYDDRGVCSALEVLQTESAGPFWHLQGSRHAI